MFNLSALRCLSFHLESAAECLIEVSTMLFFLFLEVKGWCRFLFWIEKINFSNKKTVFRLSCYIIDYISNDERVDGCITLVPFCHFD